MTYKVRMQKRELVCCGKKRIPCTLSYHKQKRATVIGSKTLGIMPLDRDGLAF